MCKYAVSMSFNYAACLHVYAYLHSLYIWVLLVPTEFVEGHFALPILFCIVCYVARIERSKVSICIIYALFVPSAFVERSFVLIRILLHCDIL